MQAISRGWNDIGRPVAGVALKVWAGHRLDLALAITVQVGVQVASWPPPVSVPPRGHVLPAPMRLCDWSIFVPHEGRSMPCAESKQCDVFGISSAQPAAPGRPFLLAVQTLVPGALGVGLSRGVRLLVATRVARSAQQHHKRKAGRSGGSGSDSEDDEEGQEDGGPAAGTSGRGASGSSSTRGRQQQGEGGQPHFGPPKSTSKPSKPPRPAPKGLGGLGLPAVPLPPLLPPDCSTQVRVWWACRHGLMSSVPISRAACRGDKSQRREAAGACAHASSSIGCF